MPKHLLQFVLLLSGAVLLSSNTLRAEPGIRTVTPESVFAHGTRFTIQGNAFKTKNRPAPYIWDDCSAADPGEKWDFVYPNANDPAFRLTYRSPSQVTKAGGRTGGAPLPHNHITKYFAGAHYNSGALDAHAGWDVCAGKNNQEGYIYTYISYYVRADPDWYLVSPDGNDDHNYKEYDYAAGSGYMGDGQNYYFGLHGFENSQGEWGANYPEFNIDMTRLRVDRALMTYYDEIEMPPPQTPTYMVFPKVGGPSPLSGWQKIELVLKHNSSDGFNRFYVNNKLVWEVYLDDDAGIAPAARSETVFGGYARDAGRTEDYKNNWRYYADIYYDHSLARVMLADNADYDLAGIVEPQIITQWEDGSISAIMNVGRLPDSGTAYLFVFDADNIHNSVGQAITLGRDPGDVVRPAAPAGVTVQ